MVPDPTYPIHKYCIVIAGGEVRGIPLKKDSDFLKDMLEAYKQAWPRPKMLIISFPHNPTTKTIDIDFFEKVVDFAKEHDVIIVHDLAYADLVFDGYKCPSFLQVKGAKDVGVELFSMSKSYNMPGWRVGFCVGNKKLVGALQSIKSYLDYGIFQPIQIASIVALNGPQDCVLDIAKKYEKRRDVLVDGLKKIGWSIEKPKATMFVWAEIPDKFKKMGSLEFTKLMLKEAKVAVSPGIGFGEYGDEHVRFALVENEQRTRQAIKGIKSIL
jgi:alanine-synthesizing transaminase